MREIRKHEWESVRKHGVQGRGKGKLAECIKIYGGLRMSRKQ